MAVHKTIRKYVVVAPNGLAVEDTEAVGKSESIRYFLLAAGHKSTDISTPTKKYGVWEPYKFRGFKCVPVDDFNAEMDAVDREVAAREEQRQEGQLADPAPPPAPKKRAQQREN